MKKSGKTSKELAAERRELGKKLAETQKALRAMQNAKSDADAGAPSQAEKALEKSQAELSAILDNAPLLMMLVDRERLVQKINGYGTRFAGRSAEEILGLPGGEALRCVHALDDPKGCGFGPSCESCKIRNTVLDTFNTGKSHRRVEAELAFFRDGKKEENHILVSTAVLDVSGSPMVLVCLEDVTERKRAEEALRSAHDEMEGRVAERTAELTSANERLHREIEERRQAEEVRLRLEAAAEQTEEGILIIDANGRIQYFNPVFERLLGYAREAIVGKNCDDVFTGEDRDREFYKAIRDSFHRADSSRGRLVRKTKKGALAELDLNVSPVRDRSGSITNYVVTVRDVTHERRLEHQLRESQKMEALGTMASGIAHDFNNILMPIFIYTESVLSDTAAESPSRRRLEQVLKAARRGKELVKQIVTFSRRSRPQRTPIPVGPIVTEALKFLGASLPGTVEIRKNIQSAATVLGDPTQIHQVVMNLSSNAAHAMRERGGVLEVSLTDREVGPAEASQHPDLKPGSYLNLTVSDSGCGMDRAVLERVFEPFFTTKSPGEGSGMGLAVVHGIVKSYGGVITVRSEPGKGSTFEILLSRVEGDSAPAPATAEQIPRGNERILLVDDEEAVVSAAKDMLERLGYNVTGRTNSLEALETFRAQPEAFDLVILDQVMSRMTGLELASELKRIRPAIPLILCTGYGDATTEARARSAGVREFVMKPLTTGEIAGIVRRLLDEKA
jgi:PAS domain S-box-containing protein